MTPEEALVIARRLSPLSLHLRRWVELIDRKRGGLSYLSAARRSDDASPHARRGPDVDPSGQLLRATAVLDELPAAVAREMLRLGIDENGDPIPPFSEEETRRRDRGTWISTTLGRRHGS